MDVKSDNSDLFPVVVMDIETDRVDDKLFKDLGPLAPKHIKVVCVRVFEEGEIPFNKWFDSSTELSNFLNKLQAKTIVGHNIIRFDLPVLKRLWRFELDDVRIIDTLICSKLQYPTFTQHSLEAWGVRLKHPKKIMPDAGASLDAWVDYCMRDVAITSDIYWRNWSIPEATVKLEHRFAQLFAEQYENGVHFDAHQATILHADIQFEMDRLEAAILSEIGEVDIPESRLHYPPKRQFNSDGSPSILMQKYCNKYGYILMQGRNYPGGVFLPNVWLAVNPNGPKPYNSTVKTLPLTDPLVTTEVLNLNNQQQLKNKLLDMGWEPVYYNYVKKDGKPVRSSPRLYDKDSGDICPNLGKVGFDHVEDLKDWLTLRARRNILMSETGNSGWLNNARLLRDSRLSADADTVGAITGRVTHKVVANVPRVSSFLGERLRKLFGPGNPEWVQVGWDATALEACMEAHYTYKYDNGAYAKIVMGKSTSGLDVHTINQHALGLMTRDDAKTFKYAVTYGAMPPKLARTFGWTLDHAQKVYDDFWSANPALYRLKQDLEKEWTANGGKIKGIDGRMLYPRHKGTVLNTLLQSAGAIVMKYSAVLADKMIRRERLFANPMIRYHDEEQWEALASDAERVGELGVLSIKYAGKYLNLNVELGGEYKIGNNWAECH